MNVDDIIYTLFRQKWLILGFTCLGIAAALAVRVLRPPPFMSEAKIMVHYVAEGVAATASPSGSDSQMNSQPLDAGTEAIIRSEIEILTGFDVAKIVATNVGPERILAKNGGGNDPLAAAGVVCSGIEVAPPRSAVLKISFKHPDIDLVQPVLTALIQAYMDEHVRIRLGGGIVDATLIHERNELSRKLAESDAALKRLQRENKILFLDDTENSKNEIAEARKSLNEAQLQLNERRAMLGDLGRDTLASGITNGADAAVPSEILNEYSESATELESLRKQERELRHLFTEAYPTVARTHAQIEKLENRKAELEHKFPALTHLALGGSQSSTNAIAGEVNELKRLTATVAIRGAYLSNLEAQVAHVLEVEPKLKELKRQCEYLERSYSDVVRTIQRRQIGESGSSQAINISSVESPTPPRLDSKKMMKLMGVALAGCIGMGLALAFLIDLMLDRSIKRQVDIERRLRLPLFLAIPDTTWTGRARSPWFRRKVSATVTSTAGATANGNGNSETALEPWNPGHHLQIYAEGLRERILTFFEVRNLNLKKPKMVAVTGCNPGSGVSTLASGLAAALSKTGDGNVLLVDMKGDQGAAHPFYKGKPGCGLADVLEPESRAEGQIEENLYMATIRAEGNEKLVKVMPGRFTSLMPQLKASDYDFIIFDMPPVSQTSPTPRLAGYMDLVLLVLESEKTSQHTAARASALMRESKANVAAVLNKYRQHVPAALAQE